MRWSIRVIHMLYIFVYRYLNYCICLQNSPMLFILCRLFSGKRRWHCTCFSLSTASDGRRFPLLYDWTCTVTLICICTRMAYMSCIFNYINVWYIYIDIRSIIIYNTLICIHMLSHLHTHTSAVFFSQIQQCMEPLSLHDSFCLVSGTLVTKKANRWNAFWRFSPKGFGIHCQFFFFWLLFAKPKIVGLLSLWCFYFKASDSKVRCGFFDVSTCRFTKSRRCQCRPRLGESAASC